MKTAILTAAIQYLDGGLSVIPIRADGSKAPAVPAWKPYQERRMTPEEAERLFAGDVGIAVICGTVSGGLETIDFDQPELVEPWCAAVEESDPGLLARLPRIATPRGGAHFMYRCSAVAGNAKLAVERITDGPTGMTTTRVLIETRGEGGYVVTVPSSAACHPSARVYVHVAGPTLQEIPVITPEEREILLSTARSFNLVPDHVEAGPSKDPKAGTKGLRPGDDFSARADWREILSPAGWTAVRAQGGVTYWRRPGKEGSGCSATTGHCKTPAGLDLLYNFSANGHPLEAGKAYTKFAAYALLHHGGDFSSAARDLAREGYGTARTVGPEAEFHLTDSGNAERFAKLHGQNVRFVRAWEGWILWDLLRWRPDATEEVKLMAKATARSIYAEAASIEDADLRKRMVAWGCSSESARARRAMLELFAIELGVPLRHDELDRDPWALNVQNGTIDLRTGGLRPHRREDLITKLAPVNYDPDAEAPVWEAFLQRILGGNKALIDYICRVVGYGLTGDVREDVLFFLFGTGANGKTTFLNAIRDVVGHDYASEIDPEILMVKRYASHPTGLADLFGKRFVSTVEVEDGQRLAEVLVKRLTGRDQISARKMRENYWRFAPSHKLFLAANYRPVIRGTDYGIWRRIRLIPFNVTIPRSEQDRTLAEKLRAEREGILAWIVRGAVEWYRDGLKDPPEVLAATEDYRVEMDTLADFFAERCLLSPTARVSAADLFGAYTDWHKRAVGGEPVTQTAFGRRLGERGFVKKRGAGGPTFWHGIGLIKGADGETK